MKRSETDVLYDANGEAGSFLTQHPLLCLTDTIFEDTEAGPARCFDAQITNSFRFVGGSQREQRNYNDQNEAEAKTGRKQAGES